MSWVQGKTVGEILKALRKRRPCWNENLTTQTLNLMWVCSTETTEMFNRYSQKSALETLSNTVSPHCYTETISIHQLSIQSVQFRATGGLEPILAAIGWEAMYTLDRSTVTRATQTTMHTHPVEGSQCTWNEPMHTWEEHTPVRIWTRNPLTVRWQR